MDPFAEFDRVQAETKPLTKTIGNKDFTFPGACPADVALELLTLLMANPNSDPVSVATTQIPRLIEEKDLTELLNRVTWPEFEALTKGLFTHYGLLSEETKGPNRQARRASKRASSKSSARSGQTSRGSTRSASQKDSKTSLGKSS